MSTLIPDAPGTPVESPAPPASTRAPEDGALYVTEHLLSVMREDLGRADTKASMLLSGAAAVLAVYGAERSGAEHGWRLVICAGAIGFWALGIIALVAAVLPRSGSTAHPSRVSHYGAMSFAEDTAELHTLLREAGRDPAGWMALQARDVGLILTAKYRCIRFGAACLGVGGVLALIGSPW
jgi:hypothetical protein